jgi:hypothetical protein
MHAHGTIFAWFMMSQMNKNRPQRQRKARPNKKFSCYHGSFENFNPNPCCPLKFTDFSRGCAAA